MISLTGVSSVEKERKDASQTTVISAFILQDDLSGRSMYDPVNVIWSHCLPDIVHRWIGFVAIVSWASHLIAFIKRAPASSIGFLFIRACSCPQWFEISSQRDLEHVPGLSRRKEGLKKVKQGRTRKSRAEKRGRDRERFSSRVESSDQIVESRKRKTVENARRGG